ncbi:hypothetical protein IM711_04765 [Microbacterium esteraromaticum]|uniref:hypothetical protein n=1 Tax=Microbacterium esteraromaticum TaxID=57043 RepID=UPI0015CDCE6D
MEGELNDGPVRAVYVVLTHRNWAQVRRLAGAILASSPDARVLLAHDARSEVFPAHVDDPRIRVFVHGLECDWGSWELVEATLRAMERARELWDPQLVTLISGDDYPMRRLPDWEREALAASGWIGEAHALTYRPRWGRRRGEGDDRLNRYTFFWFRASDENRSLGLPEWLRAFASRVRRALAVRLEPVFGVRYVARGRGRYFGVRRPTPFTRAMPCHIGAQWVALRRHELDVLLDEDLAPRSRLRRFYRRTIIPDESALVTPLSWRGAPADLPPVTLYQWDPVLDTTITWTHNDLDRLLASGAPFCRKIDADRSGALMDSLDRLIA